MKRASDISSDVPTETLVIVMLELILVQSYRWLHRELQTLSPAPRRDGAYRATCCNSGPDPFLAWRLIAVTLPAVVLAAQALRLCLVALDSADSEVMP
jgi:hypothetical protein